VYERPQRESHTGVDGEPEIRERERGTACQENAAERMKEYAERNTYRDESMALLVKVQNTLRRIQAVWREPQQAKRRRR